MQITTLSFFIFTAVSLAVYFCVPKRFQWCVLLAASYVFYAFAGVQLLVYILSATLTVYLCGLFLKDSGRPKLLIAFVIIFNFAVLASFKWRSTSLLLPLGISFYTFQAVGYLIDVYRKVIEPERNIAKFALFVSFFPQLVQGPISRHSELAGQLYAERSFDHKQALYGLQLMLWGLFKKLAVADRMVVFVFNIFDGTGTYGGVYTAIGLVSHVLWLYMDFSGGVDIARGIGHMFGIDLPRNFIRPFFSTNLPEYWRRWHVTLNNWWRDYLFYPFIRSAAVTRLSKFTRKNISSALGKVIGVYLGILIVRVINAMWHGADAFFIAEGLYFGIFIVLGMVLAPLFKRVTAFFRLNTSSAGWKVFSIVRTFTLLCVSRVFMATGGVRSGFSALVSMVRDFDLSNLEFGFFSGLEVFDIGLIGVSLIIVFVVDMLGERGVSLRDVFNRQPLAVQWLIMMVCLWGVFFLGRYGFGYDPAAFVYMEF